MTARRGRAIDALNYWSVGFASPRAGWAVGTQRPHHQALGILRRDRGTPTELAGVLDFLRAAERLKSTTRTGYTSTGQQESVAEHTWRLCLMALVLRPGVSRRRLREAREDLHHPRPWRSDPRRRLGAGTSAPRSVRCRQPARLTTSAAISSSCSRRCRRGFATRSPRCGTSTRLRASPEAKLAKALDKLETIMQHNQGLNPADFDYRFNLGLRSEAHRGHSADRSGARDPRRRNRAARSRGGRAGSPDAMRSTREQVVADFDEIASALAAMPPRQHLTPAERALLACVPKRARTAIDVGSGDGFDRASTRRSRAGRYLA